MRSLRRVGLTNPQYDLLALAAGSRIGITALEAFRAKYRTSGQPGKKVAGLYQTLHRLAGYGLLNERGGATAYKYSEVRFELNPAGRQAFIAAATERSRRHADRPTFPRLAAPAGAEGGGGHA
jgi:hypothetical protein